MMQPVATRQDRRRAMDLQSGIELHNGVVMPRLGLGVYQTPTGRATHDAVTWALQAGYRHVDTARAYGNERDVGQAIRDSDVPRGEIFVTTKLRTSDHGHDEALRGFDASFRDLGLAYVDLFLSHFPVTGK